MERTSQSEMVSGLPDNHVAAKDAAVNDTTVGHTSATQPALCANRQKIDTKTPQYFGHGHVYCGVDFIRPTCEYYSRVESDLFMIQVALFFAPKRERIAFSFREAMARSTVRLLNPVLVAMAAIEI